MRRAGRGRRAGRNWCDAAAPTAIRHAPRHGVSAALWSRSGVVPPPATAFRPRPGGHDLCLGAALRCRAPLATAFRPRPGAAPPATAPRPRSGAVPPRRRIGIAPVPRPLRQRFDPALGATTLALASRPGAVPPPLGTTTLALGATTLAGGTTLALASRPRFWAVFPPRCRDPRRPGGHDLCPGAVPPALGTTAFALGRAPALCPRSGGARCEKPSLLVAGGQNGRFFAVSEVGNGRFCRLFAYGLSDSANNRAF